MSIRKANFTAKDVKTVMEQLGFNQTEMSKVLGISRQTMNGYLRGYVIPLQIEKHLKLLDSISRMVPK
jgi:DNA-binding XRE family transcriptional regulator